MQLSKSQLLKDYKRIRQASLAMCTPLIPEQCRIQPIPEVSPPWWNLAHTSWFFVRNILEPCKGQSTPEDELFDYVLNSYYAALGPRIERNKRGLVTRPTMDEVYAYRKSVDERMETLLSQLSQAELKRAAPIVFLGFQHEQQHQELFYSEIKYILHQNPLNLRTPYKKAALKKNHSRSPPEAKFIGIPGGLHEIGNREKEWGWDNEYPVHKYYLNDFSLMNRLVTNGEYLEFVLDGGYETQLLWLNNGWNMAVQEQWKTPLYWEQIDGVWHTWTLNGMQKLNLNEPVCHISFYEAEAYATWKKARLPTEQEWEHAARTNGVKLSSGNFVDTGKLHPETAATSKGLTQMLGDVWEWTSSYYEPYPGYVPYTGNLREYNEKFMDNQRVMRGGSCVSERDHLRISYRNFWPPETRFQFAGLRLAKF